MATIAQIRETLFERLDTNWSTTSIAWPNYTFDPTGLKGWVRATILWADNFRETIVGDGTTTGQKIVGTFVIQVFTEHESGVGNSETYANTIADLFNEQRLSIAGADGTVDCEVPRFVHVGDDGAWYQLNVEVPFTHLVE